MSGPVPVEQGATRRYRATDLMRAIREDARGRPYFDLSEINRRVRPAWAPETFGRRASRRIASRLERGAARRFVIESTPFGRVMDAYDVFDTLREMWEEANRPKRIFIPGELGHPDYANMAAHGWTVDANWPPPFKVGYTSVYGYRRNMTASGEGQHDLSAFNGDPIALGDFMSIAVGDGIFPIIQGVFTEFGETEPVLHYANQGYAIKTSTSTEPDVGSAPETKFVPGFFNPWPELNPNIARDLASEPQPQVQREQALQNDLDTIVAEAVEVGPDGKRQVPLAPRAPAPPGERQRKMLSKSKAFMVATFKALDNVSELSEIVDVFYDSIPKKTRQAYEKSLGFHWVKYNGKWRWFPPQKPRGLFGAGQGGLLDNAGQYGIDGADWKSVAVWKYWRQIDAEAAFRGLINNQTQDFAYGQLYKRLPKNLGHAADEGFLAFNKALKNLVYQ